MTAVALGSQLLAGSASAASPSTDTDHAQQHAATAHTDAGSGHTTHRPLKPTARHDATQTAVSARQSTRNAPGYCLRWAHLRAGIPPRYPTAADAWRHATDRHPGDRRPPAGAAVYWTGGSHGFGHIAISVGHGKVRSTDAAGEGHVATVGVGWAHRNWGLRYAGWADSINGYTIPGVATHHRP
ncbi:MAG: hypothetical protein ACXVW8_05415 [Nocardioidaceae bacterium]